MRLKFSKINFENELIEDQTEYDKLQWEMHNNSHRLYGATGIGTSMVPTQEDLDSMLEKRREYKSGLLLREVINDGFKPGAISSFYGLVPHHPSNIPEFYDGRKAISIHEPRFRNTNYSSGSLGLPSGEYYLTMENSIEDAMGRLFGGDVIIIDSLGTMEEALGIKPKPEPVPFVDKFTTPRNRKERRAAKRRTTKKGGD